MLLTPQSNSTLLYYKRKYAYYNLIVQLLSVGLASGRIATFSLWTSMFRDGISSIPGETVTPLRLGRHFVCENRVYHEMVRTTVG